MLIMIDLKNNYIEIDGNKDPDLNIQNVLENIAKNIDKYDVKQVNIREELIKLFAKKIKVKPEDIIPRSPIDR